MDLKIKDVADLLNVSESTIQGWVSEGKIPAYKINQQYRFSRIEIENWMLSSKLAEQERLQQIYPPPTEESQRSGMQQFSLYRAIHQGAVLSHVPGTSKEELIRGTTALISQRLGVDGEILADLLMDRENLMPTSINHGIAVPHTRDFLIKGPFDLVAVVYPQKPIEYGALDGNPVHTLFFLFGSSDKRHLHLLAKIAHLSNNPETLKFLQTKPDKTALLEYVRDWESKVRHFA